MGKGSKGQASWALSTSQTAARREEKPPKKEQRREERQRRERCEASGQGRKKPPRSNHTLLRRSARRRGGGHSCWQERGAESRFFFSEKGATAKMAGPPAPAEWLHCARRRCTRRSIGARRGSGARRRRARRRPRANCESLPAAEPRLCDGPAPARSQQGATTLRFCAADRRS
jgi:hypothetical protein